MKEIKERKKETKKSIDIIQKRIKKAKKALEIKAFYRNRTPPFESGQLCRDKKEKSPRNIETIFKQMKVC